MIQTHPIVICDSCAAEDEAVPRTMPFGSLWDENGRRVPECMAEVQQAVRNLGEHVGDAIAEVRRG